MHRQPAGRSASDGKQQSQKIDAELAALKAEHRRLGRANRPPSERAVSRRVRRQPARRWRTTGANTAPGDDTPGGDTAVQARRDRGARGAASARRPGRSLESGDAGDRWLSTRQAFDWTPDAKGDWIQVTFDLVDDKARPATDAGRAGRAISSRCTISTTTAATPAATCSSTATRPAARRPRRLSGRGLQRRPAKSARRNTQPGHNYGVRITNVGGGKFRSGAPGRLVLPETSRSPSRPTISPTAGSASSIAADRSFVVDNVRHRASRRRQRPARRRSTEPRQTNSKRKRKELRRGDQSQGEPSDGEPPGKIAWVTDRSPKPPEVYLLVRGNYATPGDKVEPVAARPRSRRSGRRRSRSTSPAGAARPAAAAGMGPLADATRLARRRR